MSEYIDTEKAARFLHGLAGMVSTRYWMMTEDGYRRGAPSHEAADIDGPIAQKHPCRQCGGQCRYEAWHRDGNRPSYIAYTVCTICGYAEEF